jgi:acyl dehydratase
MLLRALFKRPRGTAAHLPVVRSSYTIDSIDRAQLRAYNAALGFAPDALPVTFHYLLAQRAQLATMLGAAFPFRIPGMIHVSNDLVEHRVPDAHRPLVIHTTAETKPPEPLGAVHVIVTTVAGQDGQPVFTCSSDYLAVRGQRAAKANKGHHADVHPPVLASWELDAASGRRYAAISGDWNPIHLWRWSARLMGMRTPNIHGMHTVAKACALLEATTARRIVSISARFKAPIPLPGAAALAADTQAGSFAVTSQGRDAVLGAFTFTNGPDAVDPASIEKASASE